MALKPQLPLPARKLKISDALADCTPAAVGEACNGYPCQQPCVAGVHDPAYLLTTLSFDIDNQVDAAPFCLKFADLNAMSVILRCQLSFLLCRGCMQHG